MSWLSSLLSSIVISSRGEKGTGHFVGRLVVCPHFLFHFLSSLCQRKAAMFDCGIAWKFFHYYELQHDRTNKMACAPSEDSDQPGHPPSRIRVFPVRMKKAWALSYPLSASEDSDQTGRMPRLIRVFAGRTCHFVGFVMRRLFFSI